jgi:hypothetical protein
VVAGAAAGPLAGARVHPRVSAPPSSGSVTVPLGPVPHTDERWRSDECSTRPAHPHGAHQGNSGGGDGGGKPQVGPLRFRTLILDLGLVLGFDLALFRFEIDSFGHFFSQTRSTT